MEMGDPPMPSWGVQHEAKPGWLTRSPVALYLMMPGNHSAQDPHPLLPLSAAPLWPQPSPPLPLPLPNFFAQIRHIL